jgi:tetratricopeptide (TPR) repeat protein
VRKQAWLATTAIVACGLAAGLWTGLEFGAGYDPGAASAAGLGLGAFLGALGTAWAQLADGCSGGPKDASLLGTGSLKGVTRTFADRVAEYADVKARVRRWGSREEAGAAFMIYGMPGVGKSEFARHAAHKLMAEFRHYTRRRGLNMLGRHIELHGLEGLGRTDPRDALTVQLEQLVGPDPRRAKMNLDDLSAEWRNYLQGKFLVLVLDNAVDEGQVLPFLPGGSPFILLITGRRMLQGLVGGGVMPYHLGVLSKDGATQMIKNIVDRQPSNGDQDSIEEIAERCGYHPLAITLAVGTLASKPNVSFAGRLGQMNRNANRLLAIDEYADKERGGVARSFDLSYTQLSDPAKLVLRKLGLAPVPTVNVEAATALADLPVEAVTSSLRELADEALIEENGTGESYQMHDLIRRYAASLAVHDDRSENVAAINRLLAYYHVAAAYTDSLLTRQPTPEAVESPAPGVSHNFADRRCAIEWARAELPNLLACADYVVQSAESDNRHEWNAWVVLFARALAGVLRNEGRWRRSIELQTQAVKSAEKIHVPLGVANALSERGMLYRLTAELNSSVVDLKRAISIYREVGGKAGLTGEAHALNTYGVVLDQLDKRDESRQRLSEALDIYHQTANLLGEANILHDRGMTEFSDKNYETAVQLLGQALELYKTVDQLLGMAHAYSNLARAQQHVGAEQASAANLESAAVLYRDLGNRLGEINVLLRLAAVLREHDRDRAVKILNDAVRLSIDIGNQLARIDALDALGDIYMASGDRKTAADVWSSALRTAREHGMPREEGKLADKVRRVR